MRPRCVDCVIVGIVAAACRCINHHLNIEIPNVFVRRIFASHLFCSDSPQPRTCSPRPLVSNHAHALMADSFPRLAPTVCVAFNKRRDTPSHLPSPCAATCGSLVPSVLTIASITAACRHEPIQLLSSQVQRQHLVALWGWRVSLTDV